MSKLEFMLDVLIAQYIKWLEEIAARANQRRGGEGVGRAR